jgi:hypothetical protein
VIDPTTTSCDDAPWCREPVTVAIGEPPQQKHVCDDHFAEHIDAIADALLRLLNEEDG